MLRAAVLTLVSVFAFTACGGGVNVPAALGRLTCATSLVGQPVSPAYANTTWPSEHHDTWRTHAVAAGLPASINGSLNSANAALPPAPIWGYVGLDGNVYVLGGSPYLLDVFTKLILGAPPSTIAALIAQSLVYSQTVTPYIARINPSTMAVTTLNLTAANGVNYTGGMLVDSNGYIYATARGYLYKIDPQTLSVVLSTQLPLAPTSSGAPNPLTAYNGVQATQSGDLIIKGFASIGNGPGILLRINPADLSIEAQLQSTQIAAARMMITSTNGQEYIYLPGSTSSTRILLTPTSFVFDDAYSQQYLFPNTGTTEGSSDVFMGQGIVFANNTDPSATAPMSVFAQGAYDGAQLQGQPAFNGTGAGWNFFMVAGDPFASGIVAVENQVSGHIAGFTACNGGTSLQKLWENDSIDGSAGMAINYASGQLYADDHQCTPSGTCKLFFVVLDLHTGKEIARTAVAGSEPSIGQIFIGPNNAVLYLATDTNNPNGYITRVTAP